MFSMCLGEVLVEQTGLAVVADHGNGIQVQGFNSDYTLILINGQPIIGRTAGTLELDRITVNNIKQIEITKGPSSSLYGSEALAGVINIITSDLEWYGMENTHYHLRSIRPTPLWHGPICLRSNGVCAMRCSAVLVVEWCD